MDIDPHPELCDLPAERALRDSRLSPIGGGTTEIPKRVISRTLPAY